MVAYHFQSNVLLGIGDPIGPEEELPALLHSFAQFSHEHDWDLAFFQARPERLPLYKSLGWRTIHIGEDPILSPGEFSLEGSAMGDVRRATRKLEETGWEVRSYVPGVNPISFGHDPDGIPEQLRSVSADWMNTRHGGEKGFCMGRFDPAWLRGSWVEVAWNPVERRTPAFVTWVPVPGRHGWALDLTRRRENAPNGVMDFLIAKSVESARARGDSMLSLSLSALADVDVRRRRARTHHGQPRNRRTNPAPSSRTTWPASTTSRASSDGRRSLRPSLKTAIWSIRIRSRCLEWSWRWPGPRVREGYGPISGGGLGRGGLRALRRAQSRPPAGSETPRRPNSGLGGPPRGTDFGTPQKARCISRRLVRGAGSVSQAARRLG